MTNEIASPKRSDDFCSKRLLCVNLSTHIIIGYILLVWGLIICVTCYVMYDILLTDLSPFFGTRLL